MGEIVEDPETAIETATKQRREILADLDREDAEVSFAEWLGQLSTYATRKYNETDSTYFAPENWLGFYGNGYRYDEAVDEDQSYD